MKWLALFAVCMVTFALFVTHCEKAYGEEASISQDTARQLELHLKDHIIQQQQEVIMMLKDYIEQLQAQNEKLKNKLEGRKI